MNDAHESESSGRSAPRGVFGPWVLLAVSLIMVLGWNARQTWRQRQVATGLLAQQANALQQADATGQRLQALLSDLVVLAQRDPQARNIIEKYQIRQAQPADAPAVPPTAR